MNTKTSDNELKSPQSNGQGQEQELEISLHDIFYGLYKFWWLCILLTLLGAATMFVKSYVFFKPVYESSATFTVQTQNTAVSSGDDLSSYSFSYNKSAAAQLSDAFPSIIESNILQDIILNDLGIDEIPAELTASSVSDTNMFVITATGNDPELTYRVIISTMKNYPAVAEYVIGNTNITVLNDPVVPTEPSNLYDYITHMLLGALVGLMLSAAWIVVYMMFRQTIRSRREIREKLNQHCLGSLPTVVFKKYRNKANLSVLINNTKVGDGYMESFRALRNSFLHSLTAKQKIIMVTSTAPGEGKSTVSTNLALSLAKLSKNVLLVDADLRNPSINKLLDLDLIPDPTSTLPAKIDKLTQLGLSVMNFNTTSFDLWKIMRVDFLKELFGQLRDTYDYIIVDTPPMGLTSDPSIIAQACDASMLVIREDTVRVSKITASISSLLYSGTNLIGCILNGVDSGFSSYGGHYGSYGYGYGYGYGSGSGYGSGGGYGSGYGESKPRKRPSERPSEKKSYENSPAT